MLVCEFLTQLDSPCIILMMHVRMLLKHENIVLMSNLGKKELTANNLRAQLVMVGGLVKQ